ncbi:MAG: hypothetical protein ACXVEQ_00160 [Nocardioidaceae bacterium]
MTPAPDPQRRRPRRGEMSRRSFLRGAAGTLTAAAPALSAGAAFATPSSLPGMPSASQIWSWQQRLVGFGTRYTASPGHVRFVDWLSEQFAAIPGFRLYTDRLTFNRWLARTYSLSVDQPSAAGPSGPVPLTYYYPYSGTTPTAGVTGGLVDLGTYTPAVPGTAGTGYTPEFWAAAKGKIALVRTAPSTFCLAAGQAATGGFEPGRSSDQAAADYETYAAAVTNPAWQGIFSAIPLLDARNAGVLGVVCAWTGMPDDEVAHQYNPFITPYPATSGLPTPGDPGCPAVWVGDATGHALSQAAANGQATATLRLTADVTAAAATETVWGVLKGSGGTGESIIINTHTDGPNATEENGGLGLLALATYFAGRPHNRDLYFVLVTGHFQLPQFTRPIPDARPEVGSDATSVWLTDHPDLYPHAVAGVTVEHLGCTRWGNDPVTGAYGPTGGFDWGATYTMQRQGSLALTNLEEQAYLAAVRRVNRSGHVNTPVATLRPGAVPLYLGEGAPLYAAGLGTVSLVPAPPYLLQAGTRAHPELLNLDQLDKSLIYGQVLTFAHTIRALDQAPPSAF